MWNEINVLHKNVTSTSKKEIFLLSWSVYLSPCSGLPPWEGAQPDVVLNLLVLKVCVQFIDIPRSGVSPILDLIFYSAIRTWLNVSARITSIKRQVDSLMYPQRYKAKLVAIKTPEISLSTDPEIDCPLPNRVKIVGQKQSNVFKYLQYGHFGLARLRI